MKSTTGMAHYLKSIFALFIFNCFMIFAYSEKILGVGDETELRKLVLNSKVVNSNIEVPSIVNSASLIPEDSTIKHVTKRQQYSQAKPILQLPSRRTDQPKKQRVDSCPLCDSSVFSYCSDKLLHDACCCLNPYENNLPYQCQYADCSFLHANTCREHHLITACCCDRYLFK